MFKIKSGDHVIVISGSEKGKNGKVLKVLPKENKLIVSGLNMGFKHKKPTGQSEGGVFKKEMPIHKSNVALMDSITNKPMKVKFEFSDNGRKTRITSSGKKLVYEKKS